MGTTDLTLESRFVRMTSADFERVLHEAADQLAYVRRDYERGQRASAEKALAEATDTGASESTVEQHQRALSRINERLEREATPKWWMSHAKSQEVEIERASIDEISPRVRMPRPYSYVSITFQSDESSMELVFSMTGLEIKLRSNDRTWIQHARAWATQTLAAVTPRRVFWHKPLGRVLLIGGGAALAWLTIYGAPAWFSVPSQIAVPLGLGFSVASAAAAFAVAASPRAVIAPQLGVRTRGLVRDIAWAIAGGAIGIALDRTAAAIWPPS